MAFCFGCPWLRREAGGELCFDGVRSIKNQADTDPPLLVLLSVHHDHLALRERQLVWVIGHTVVDGFHSLRSLFLENKTHGDAQVSVQSLVCSRLPVHPVFMFLDCGRKLEDLEGHQHHLDFGSSTKI